MSIARTGVLCVLVLDWAVFLLVLQGEVCRGRGGKGPSGGGLSVTLHVPDDLVKLFCTVCAFNNSSCMKGTRYNVILDTAVCKSLLRHSHQVEAYTEAALPAVTVLGLQETCAFPPCGI